MGSKNKKTSASSGIFRMIVLMVFFAFILFVIGRAVWSYLRQSDYFKITDIWYEASLKSIESSELAGLKGKNLLSVNLEKIQKQLQFRYPQYRQLTVLRRFPNQILVVAKRRAFFAQTKINHHSVTIDEKGTIVSLNAESDEMLPFIAGISSAKGRLQVGAFIDSYQLQLALNIIRAFQSEKLLSAYRISRVDIGNLSEINFYIVENLKVIIDQDNYAAKIRMLGFLLSRIKPEEDIKYIDLRFKEPILGKK